MDINRLLAGEQIALYRARTAPTAEAREAHAELAAHYGLELADHLFPHRRPTAVALTGAGA